jgi:hypothetical protein
MSTMRNDAVRRAARNRRAAPLLAILAGVALCTAACGGSSSSAGSGTGQGSGAGGSAASDQIKFANCMRSHGITNFPEPSANGGPQKLNSAIDIRSPQFLAAQQACQHLAPGGGKANPAAASQNLNAMLKYVSCMRRHGVPSMPDPNSNGTLTLPSGLNPQSPQFQSAQQACQKFLPGGLG